MGSLGARWAFSFQPVLPSDYRPVVQLLQSRTRARRLTQSPELGFRAFFSLPGTVLTLLFLAFDLRGCGNRNSAAVVQRFVHFSAYPQVMQQHGQLPCRGHNRSLLSVPSTALGQL